MGEKWKQWQTLFSWAPKSLWTMTASRKLRHLFLEKKSMTNLYNVLRSRDITLPTKVHIVKIMFFSVVMYGCESWTIKKAECHRIDAFELWCRRRLLVPSTARRTNQSILKENNPDYSLEGLMLKLQYFAPWCKQLTHWKKTLMLGKTEQEEKGMTEDELVWWHRWLSGHEFEQTLGDSEGQGVLVCCSPWSAESDSTMSLYNKKTLHFLSWRLFCHLQRQCIVSWILLSNPPIFLPSLPLQPSQVPCIRTLITAEWSR